MEIVSVYLRVSHGVSLKRYTHQLHDPTTMNFRLRRLRRAHARGPRLTRAFAAFGSPDPISPQMIQLVKIREGQSLLSSQQHPASASRRHAGSPSQCSGSLFTTISYICGYICTYCISQPRFLDRAVSLPRAPVGPMSSYIARYIYRARTPRWPQLPGVLLLKLRELIRHWDRQRRSCMCKDREGPFRPPCLRVRW